VRGRKRKCRSLKVLNPIEFHVDNSDAGARLVERYQHRNMRNTRTRERERERGGEKGMYVQLNIVWMEGMKRPPVHGEYKEKRENPIEFECAQEDSSSRGLCRRIGCCTHVVYFVRSLKALLPE